MESLKSINFNHEGGDLCVCMGIPEAEGEPIFDRVIEIGSSTSLASMAIEKIIKEFTGAHLAFALFIFGKVVGHSEVEARNPMAELMRMLG